MKIHFLNLHSYNLESNSNIHEFLALSKAVGLVSMRGINPGAPRKTVIAVVCAVFYCKIRNGVSMEGKISHNKLYEVRVILKIYMDACCLNRPFDDLSQDRVYLEAEAVMSIVSRCEKGEWMLVASGVIDYELSKITDVDRQEQVQMLYAAASERVKLSGETERRAAFFQMQGLKPSDSLHLALAEKIGADVFLTTDDRLIKSAQKIDLSINIANPLSWLMEVMNDGK